MDGQEGDLLIADRDDSVKIIVESQEVEVTNVQGNFVFTCADGPRK